MKALISMPPRSPNFFGRAAFAVAQAKVNYAQPEQFIRKGDEVTQLIVNRANVTRASVLPASTTTAGNGLELAQDALKNYLVSLAPYAASSHLMAKAIAAAAGTTDETRYPVRAAGAVAPAWVAENGAIPIRSSAFTLVTIGPAKKMCHMLVWSKELGKRSDAESIFNQMLREDVTAGIDAAFFATTVGSATQPAGLLYGAANSTGYAGGDRAAIENDLIYLSEAVSVSGDVTYVVGPKRLARLRVKAPDIFAHLDIVASAAVAETRIVAVDAVSLLVSVDKQPDIMKSEEAILHMSDVPLEIVDDSAVKADPVRSLYQTASVALRVIHEFDFVKRRSDAAAYIENPTW